MKNYNLTASSKSFRKYIIVFSLAFFFLPSKSFSQWVYFCEDVDYLGNPKNAATEFNIPQDGGFFKILVKLKRKVNCKVVVFDLYSVENGKEILDNSIRMSVEPYLIWFYKEITFHKEGEFHVYVYDDKDRLLGVGKVKIVQK